MYKEIIHNCYLCGSDSYKVRSGSVRDHEDIKILECNHCSLVYLSSMEHIKPGHYENSGMHDDNEPDIEKWIKTTSFDDERRFNFMKEAITNNTLLDFGCGTGNFLNIAKAYAKEVTGIELEKDLQPFFKKNNLNVFKSLDDAKKTNQKWDVITSFHVVEHLRDPRNILEQLSCLLTDDGKLIIEVPNANDALLTLYDNEAFQNFTYWSQHLFLFNQSTISDLVKQTGLKLDWVKHIQRYPLSNHLHWLATGNPAGHTKWKFMNSEKLNLEYENKLASVGMTDTIIAGISKKT